MRQFMGTFYSMDSSSISSLCRDCSGIPEANQRLFRSGSGSALSVSDFRDELLQISEEQGKGSRERVYSHVSSIWNRCHTSEEIYFSSSSSLSCPLSHAHAAQSRIWIWREAPSEGARPPLHRRRASRLLSVPLSPSPATPLLYRLSASSLFRLSHRSRRLLQLRPLHACRFSARSKRTGHS